MKAPEISVVIPLFNKEREVSRAIRSVLAQTFNNYEIIVVNDGSTDNGPAILRAIKDPRIHIFDQKNAGVSAARNRGINEGRADLIAFLDADDEWLPNFLGTINKLWNRYPHCSVFATNYLYRDVDGFLMPTILRGLPGVPWEGILEDYFKVASQSDPPICSSAVAVTKAALTSVDGFPVGVKAGEDLITWAKLALRFEIAYSTYPNSIFCLRESLFGPPTRIPDSIDMVGREFEMMLKNNWDANIRGLREYVARWHQMRTSIFLRLGKRKEAICEVEKIAKYSKKNTRLYLLLAIALLPQKICRWVLSAINHWKYNRRTRIRRNNALSIEKIE